MGNKKYDRLKKGLKAASGIGKENGKEGGKENGSGKEKTRTVDSDDGGHQNPLLNGKGCGNKGIEKVVPLKGCPVLAPIECHKGKPVCSEEEDSVMFICTNADCKFKGVLVHKECCDALEAHLLKILAGLGSARGWTEAQREANLWEKKGQSLIGRLCRCRCGLGTTRVDTTLAKTKNLEDQIRNKDKKKPESKKKTQKVLPKLNYPVSKPVSKAVVNDERESREYLRRQKNTSERRDLSASSVSSSYATYCKPQHYRTWRTDEDEKPTPVEFFIVPSHFPAHLPSTVTSATTPTSPTPPSTADAGALSYASAIKKSTVTSGQINDSAAITPRERMTEEKGTTRKSLLTNAQLQKQQSARSSLTRVEPTSQLLVSMFARCNSTSPTPTDSIFDLHGLQSELCTSNLSSPDSGVEFKLAEPSLPLLASPNGSNVFTSEPPCSPPPGFYSTLFTPEITTNTPSRPQTLRSTPEMFSDNTVAYTRNFTEISVPSDTPQVNNCVQQEMGLLPGLGWQPIWNPWTGKDGFGELMIAHSFLPAW